MNQTYFPSPLLLAGLFFMTSVSFTQPANNYGLDKEQQRFDYRRIDLSKLPPIEKYTQPKEDVFPLGYGTNHLGKITTQTGIWTELNPKVPRVTYLGLHFVNKDTGWACGQSGAVIKTMNGGSSWTISETPVNNLLLKTHSSNGQVVLVTGYDGIILRSSDEGETFVQVTSGVGNGYDLWGVQMVNDTLGWVCGLNQTLLKTTDSGLSWQPVNTGLNQHYWSLNFFNESYGMIACSGGKILKSTDGGDNWIQIQVGDTRALYTIDVIDSLHIAAAGADGKNVYSSDGGTTWISNPDIPASSATNCIDFIDADTGYSVQDVYNIRKTTNRGQSWFNPTGTYFLSEWHIQLLDDGTGYSCGEEVGGFYALNFYKRTNWLDNWDRLFINDNFNDVHFITDTTGFVLSTFLYKTIDGGINWQRVENGPGGYDIVFTDSLTGFIVSDNSIINKTTDGGTSWYLTNVPTPSGDFREIFFINSTTGWAGTIWTPTSNAKILKTTDKGENWFVQTQQSGVDGYTSIFFVDTLNGWATSRYIWQTINGGNNWIQQNYLSNDTHDDVYFMNKDTGWISMYSSITPSLYKTTNSGLNWTAVVEVIGARKFYYFPDAVHWIIIGFSRYYITNDYGANWLEFTNDVPTGLISFNAPNNVLGYSVGSKGLILRYEDTTYVPVELLSFNGKVENEQVILLWKTASEINNKGFEIQRRKFQDQLWESISFMQGNGTTTEEHSYSYTDFIDKPGNYLYRLKQIDYDGSFEYSNTIEVYINSPSRFSLSQNFPNPFNSTTTITYQIPSDEVVSLKIYDVLGNAVIIMIEGSKKAGYYSVSLNANDLSSGIYFYKLTAGEYSAIKKLIIIK